MLNVVIVSPSLSATTCPALLRNTEVGFFLGDSLATYLQRSLYSGLRHRSMEFAENGCSSHYTFAWPGVADVLTYAGVSFDSAAKKRCAE